MLRLRLRGLDGRSSNPTTVPGPGRTRRRRPRSGPWRDRRPPDAVNSDTNDTGRKGVQSVEIYLPLRAGTPLRRSGSSRLSALRADQPRGDRGLRSTTVPRSLGRPGARSTSRRWRPPHPSAADCGARSRSTPSWPATWSSSIRVRRAAAPGTQRQEAAANNGFRRRPPAGHYKETRRPPSPFTGGPWTTKTTRRRRIRRPGGRGRRRGGGQPPPPDTAPGHRRRLHQPTPAAVGATATAAAAATTSDTGRRAPGRAGIAMRRRRRHRRPRRRPPASTAAAATAWSPSCDTRSTTASWLLHYQPQTTLHSGRLSMPSRRSCAGTNPTHGLLYPDSFLPLAEQTDVIDRLTEWVLESALIATLRPRSNPPPVLHKAPQRSARSVGRSDFARAVSSCTLPRLGDALRPPDHRGHPDRRCPTDPARAANVLGGARRPPASTSASMTSDADRPRSDTCRRCRSTR